MFGKRFPIEHILNTHRRITTGRRRRIRRNAPGSQFVSFEQLEERTLLTNPLTSIPVLNSLPGAPVTIYLDFDGHTEDWDGDGVNDVNPVYDFDGDLTTFSDEELLAIEEVWARVSEDFSPFTANVTTVEPATVNNLEGIRVSIGGDGALLATPDAVGGIAFVNAFTNNASNTVYAFSDNLRSGNPKSVALTSSHEVGHALGLFHHSEYDANGVFIQEYDPGTSEIGPLLGAPFNSERDVWDNGPTNRGVTSLQDDLAVLTRDLNGPFDFREDDFGDGFGTATDLPAAAGSVTQLTQDGILETEDDLDVFRFETDDGPVTIDVTGIDLRSQFNTNNAGTNLDLVVNLFDSNGNLVASESPTNSLSATITTDLTRGAYFIEVSGADYGSVGQFTVAANVVPLPVTPVILAPSDIIENGFPTYSWTLSASASHYELQVDNVTTGVDNFLFQTPIVGTTYASPIPLQEGEYRARVRSVSADGAFSEWSEFLSFSVDVPTPAIPEFINPSPIQISILTDADVAFDWTDVEHATTYNLWVNQLENAAGQSTGDRVILVRGLTQSDYLHHRALTDGLYRAWVQAENSVGERSSWSQVPVDFIVETPSLERVAVIAPTGTSDNQLPTFRWTNVDGAVEYELWVNNRTTGESRVILETGLTGLTFTPETPLDQGTYRVWVRAIDVNGETSELANGYSLPVDFTIDVAKPGVTQLTGPLGNPVTTSSPTITWTAATNADRYELWVNNDSERIPRVIFETIDGSETSFTPEILLQDGRYKGFVRALNAAGEPGPWSEGFFFIVDDLAPPIPQITAPAVNAIGTQPDTTPTFRWTRTANAVTWRLWVNNTTTGETRVIDEQGLTTNSFTPTEPLNDGDTYVAWVRASNGTGEFLDWSEPFTFAVAVPTPGTPVLLSPEGTAVGPDDEPTATPTFVWTNQGTEQYDLFILNLDDNSRIRITINDPLVEPTTNLVNYEIQQRLAAGTYQYWVRAVNSSGLVGGWSDPRSFVIDQVASIDTSLLQFDSSQEPSEVELPEAQPVAVAPHVMVADNESAPETSANEVPVVDDVHDVDIEAVMAQWALNDWWTTPSADTATEDSSVADVSPGSEAVAVTEESESKTSIATAVAPLMLIGTVKERKNRDEK